MTLKRVAEELRVLAETDTSKTSLIDGLDRRLRAQDHEAILTTLTARDRSPFQEQKRKWFNKHRSELVEFMGEESVAWVAGYLTRDKATLLQRHLRSQYNLGWGFGEGSTLLSSRRRP